MPGGTMGRAMSFEQSERSRDWMERVRAFMDAHIIPAIPVYHRQSAEIDRWKEIPPDLRGAEGQGQGRRAVELLHAAVGA